MHKITVIVKIVEIQKNTSFFKVSIEQPGKSWFKYSSTVIYANKIS